MDLEAENFVMMSPCSSRQRGNRRPFHLHVLVPVPHELLLHLWRNAQAEREAHDAPHSLQHVFVLHCVHCCRLFWLRRLWGRGDGHCSPCFYDVRRDVLMAIAYAGIVLKLCVGFALCMQPARDCCYYIIGWDVATIPAWRNCLFCGVMALCALLLGLFIPVLNTVFGLLAVSVAALSASACRRYTVCIVGTGVWAPWES
ncbi:arginine permease [Trypanosoma cruzi]|uniref:Arginine permease n=1 Tax=Trypanosoma cruzi TaxID=5693 RepID=A0A2V2UYE5_TRYCR|nr:arginine permease [Trypanosoma cruzi]